MLRLDITEPSNSPYLFPIVAVIKRDNSLCICVDLRKLNNITVMNAKVMPNAEDLILYVKLSPAKYLTKLNLSNGS